MRAWDRDIDADFSDILLSETLCKEKYENILIHDISCKTSMGAKLWCVRYDKIDKFIKIYNGIRYVLFDCGWFDRICDRIKYLISKKKWYYR